jgi:CubicO group peptidase (beta-lactamase class C family)
MDKKTKRPTNSNSIFHIASITKTFVLELAIKAFQNNKIASLDDEVRKYVPNFYIINPFGNSQPTFREMLSHLAGLSRVSPCEDVYCAKEDTSIILERLKTRRLINAPNTEPRYSNLGIF